MAAESKEIQAILSRIANLESDLTRQRGLLTCERMKTAGVAVDDVVVFKGALYQVCTVRLFGHSKAWVKGHPQRKDKTYGKGIRNLYGEWEHAPK